MSVKNDVIKILYMCNPSIHTNPLSMYGENLPCILRGATLTPSGDKMHAFYTEKTYNVIEWFVPTSTIFIYKLDPPDIHSTGRV